MVVHGRDHHVAQRARGGRVRVPGGQRGDGGQQRAGDRAGNGRQARAGCAGGQGGAMLIEMV